MNYFYLFAIVFLALVSPSRGDLEWEICGSDADPLKLTSLSSTTDGNSIYISGSTEITEELSSPIKLKVDVQKEFAGGWKKIHCTNNFGSCTYDDICEMPFFFNKDNCPEDFVQNNWPCECPIPKGEYTAEKIKFDLKSIPHWIRKGSYKVKIHVTKHNKRVLCLKTYFTL